MWINIDQVKVLVLGLNLLDVNSILSMVWGGLYVNDFVYYGWVKKVFVQVDVEFCVVLEDLDYWFVCGGENLMILFLLFVDIQWEVELFQLFWFNGFLVIQLFGDVVFVVSFGDVMVEMEWFVGIMFDMGFEWSGLLYQDKLF